MFSWKQHDSRPFITTRIQYNASVDIFLYLYRSAGGNLLQFMKYLLQVGKMSVSVHLYLDLIV